MLKTDAMTFADGQAERRRSPRIALQIHASLREPGGSRVPIRVIDISSYGCRIEHDGRQSLATNAWLYLNQLGALYARVVWNRDTFAGLEFETPLHDAVLDSLITTCGQTAAPLVMELHEIARRSHSGALKAGESPVAKELNKLAHDCATIVLAELERSTAATPR